MRRFVLHLSGLGITDWTTVSIRAYGAQDEFSDTLARLIDDYTRAARSFDNLSRWVCIRVHAMGGLFASGLAAFLVYGRQNLSAGTIGFSLAIVRLIVMPCSLSYSCAGDILLRHGKCLLYGGCWLLNC